MGRRTTKKVETIAEDNTATTTLHQLYLYRGYLQIACCDLMESGTPCRWFLTWDPTQPVATRPLAIRKDGTWYSYGWDLTKNICELFSTGGTILTTYSYTPYGAVTAEGNKTQPIQWSSEFCDDELGLVYYNYRHYNPTEGRWGRRDYYEFDDLMSLYGFIRNTPINLVDIMGFYSSDPLGATYTEASPHLRPSKTPKRPLTYFAVPTKPGFWDKRIQADLATHLTYTPSDFNPNEECEGCIKN